MPMRGEISRNRCAKSIPVGPSPRSKSTIATCGFAVSAIEIASATDAACAMFENFKDVSVALRVIRVNGSSSTSNNLSGFDIAIIMSVLLMGLLSTCNLFLMSSAGTTQANNLLVLAPHSTT